MCIYGKGRVARKDILRLEDTWMYVGLAEPGLGGVI